MSKWTFHENDEDPKQELKEWDKELRQYIPDEVFRSKLYSRCGQRPGSDLEHNLITQYKNFKHQEFGLGVLLREFKIHRFYDWFQTVDGLIVDARNPNEIQAWLIEAKNNIDLKQGYKAIGQLYIYETLLKKEFPSFIISKVLVCNEADERIKKVCEVLKIVLFSWKEFSRENNLTKNL